VRDPRGVYRRRRSAHAVTPQQEMPCMASFARDGALRSASTRCDRESGAPRSRPEP
jgi:hypothetical protein